MLNRLLAIVLAISIAAPAIAVQARDVLVLKTVNVVLPTSDRMFPDGPGSDVVNSYCLVCHSAGMVLSQPAMNLICMGSRSPKDAQRLQGADSRRANPDDRVVFGRSAKCQVEFAGRHRGSMEAVGDDLPYQRGITFALRTIFPDGFYDSMLTLRFTSTFEMRSK